MKTVAIAVFFAVCASNIYPQSDPFWAEIVDMKALAGVCFLHGEFY